MTGPFGFSINLISKFGIVTIDWILRLNNGKYGRRLVVLHQLVHYVGILVDTPNLTVDSFRVVLSSGAQSVTAVTPRVWNRFASGFLVKIFLGSESILWETESPVSMVSKYDDIPVSEWGLETWSGLGPQPPCSMLCAHFHRLSEWEWWTLRFKAQRGMKGRPSPSFSHREEESPWQWLTLEQG